MKITKEQAVLIGAFIYLVFVIFMIWKTINDTPGNLSQPAGTNIETEQQGMEGPTEYGDQFQISVPAANSSSAGSTFDGVE
jgi:hypothetical protein